MTRSTRRARRSPGTGEYGPKATAAAELMFELEEVEQAERDHPVEPPRAERTPDEHDDYYENFSVTDSWSE